MQRSDISSLRIGDWLIIEDRRYEIVYILPEAEPVDGELLDVLTIALHSGKSLALEPTDFLRFYPERELLIFEHHDRRIRTELEDIDVEKRKS